MIYSQAVSQFWAFLLLLGSRDANIAAAIGVQKYVVFFQWLFARLNTEVYRAFRLVVPDPAVLLVAIISLAYFAKPRHRTTLRHTLDESERQGSRRRAHFSEDDTIVDNDAPGSLVRYYQSSRATIHYALSQVAKLPNIWVLHAFTVFVVAAAGVIVPSMLSAFYLLSFYLTCTYWSSCRKVYNHKLAWTRVILMIYSGLHLCLLYLYQFEYAQTILDESSFTARYISHL